MFFTPFCSAIKIKFSVLDAQFYFRYNKNDAKLILIIEHREEFPVKILKVKCLAPTRLDNYLTQQYPALTPGRLNKALRENKIKLNGKKQPLSTRVMAGDEIKLFILDDVLDADRRVDGPAWKNARTPAQVVYDCPQILIVNKPAGVAVDGPEDDTLLNRALLYLNKQGEYKENDLYTPALCHRLDTGTSGLVIIAKTPEAEELFLSAIKNREVQKTYLCVTFGRPVPPDATLGGYLLKDADRRVEGPAWKNARTPAQVVYDCPQILIVNKPAGVAVDGPEDDTLLNRALLYLNKQGEYKENDLYTPALCHRLDTGTSGLVIIAKTPEAEELFLSAIKNREVQKTYLCVTFGRPVPPDATLGGYLLKDADRGIVKIVEDKQPGAKEVETRYETIAVSGRLALLKVQLITGRTHQIRAHMASIGCPILGDSKYGNNSANRELKLKYQALCAWELTMPRFTQPDFAFLSGKTFHAPKPWYYQQVLDGTLK